MSSVPALSVPTPFRPVLAGSAAGVAVPDRLRRLARDLFLPSQYPHGVHADYVPYRAWESLATTAAAGAEFFAIQGMLAGIGVSASASTTAALAWLAKDAISGLGQLAGGLIAHRVDRDPAAWHVRAGALMALLRWSQTALIVWPGSFLVVAPLTNAGRAFAAALLGASSANIDNHLARGHDVGDLRARTGNQGMVAASLGNVLGAGLSMAGEALVGARAGPVLAAGLTLVALYATWRAGRELHIPAAPPPGPSPNPGPHPIP